MIDTVEADPHKLFFVGDRWMRRYYTVFDRDHHRIGFAPSKTWKHIQSIQPFDSRLEN